jgi:hypothetical protein
MVILDRLMSLLAYSSSMRALPSRSDEHHQPAIAQTVTYLSCQKFLRSSVVFAAPFILAKRMFTPASPTPQNGLQKSRDVPLLYIADEDDRALRERSEEEDKHYAIVVSKLEDRR